ncbi:hypothetical protein Z517_02210 [Fonsecaea pedrosoi CBS 271.37]|uniref:FHA domain-containing protein n=1 Tax=Fonsecaea pedrosoi CBS 271.37 TaxID=1442368 RepID=A0A0D2F8R2_9EURO|nr:uncharacterized protein Z517_02210 [Fonsecaea pedrosoi CBS 271.37]KIW82967.1 hypothetical protein Z517_02210 [Fonsecaea pedrosoi CBS 271.37]
MASPDVRPEPHPSTVFSLVPINGRAEAAVTHSLNSHLISVVQLPNNSSKIGINVGPHIGSSSQNTLATLGRSGADITLEGATISRIHCSFEVNENFGTILLYDRSSTQPTKFFGPDSRPFERGQIRRVVVTPEMNTLLGIGGDNCELLLFRLFWHKKDISLMNVVASRSENPRHARTLDETPTAAASRYLTRIHTPGGPLASHKYVKLRQVGAGAFGKVWKAIDTNTGRIMAVKVVKTLGLSTH